MRTRPRTPLDICDLVHGGIKAISLLLEGGESTSDLKGIK